MTKFNTALKTAVAALAIFGGMTAVSTTAQAKTVYHRSAIKTVKSTPMYSTSNKGKTYAFKGSAKKFTFKTSHNLKNYHNSTWTKTKQTTVKHGKSSSTYYYVKNAKNGAAGWVNKVYMKTGKDYQYGATKNLTAKTYIEKNYGKIYNLKGNSKWFQFKSVAGLSNSANYTVSAQKSVYKKGKTSIYYYVTGDNGTQGWIWNGYLKSGKHTASTTTSNSSSSSTTSDSNSDTPGFSWNTSNANDSWSKSGNEWSQKVRDAIAKGGVQTMTAKERNEAAYSYNSRGQKIDFNGNVVK